MTGVDRLDEARFGEVGDTTGYTRFYLQGIRTDKSWGSWMKAGFGFGYVMINEI